MVLSVQCSLHSAEDFARDIRDLKIQSQMFNVSLSLPSSAVADTVFVAVGLGKSGKY